MWNDIDFGVMADEDCARQAEHVEMLIAQQEAFDKKMEPYWKKIQGYWWVEHNVNGRCEREEEFKNEKDAREYYSRIKPKKNEILYLQKLVGDCQDVVESK